jgi:hypothetical protein
MNDKDRLEMIKQYLESRKEYGGDVLDHGDTYWLIETIEHLQKENERYRGVLERIATPGLGLGYWEAKKTLEE